jgi:hypothetical protein
MAKNQGESISRWRDEIQSGTFISDPAAIGTFKQIRSFPINIFGNYGQFWSKNI